MAQLKRKLAGYWNYYGITGNSRSLGKYWWSILGLLHKWLNRRSHRRSYTWKGLMACLANFRIPPPRITEQANANANDSDRQLWFIFAN